MRPPPMMPIFTGDMRRGVGVGVGVVKMTEDG